MTSLSSSSASSTSSSSSSVSPALNFKFYFHEQESFASSSSSETKTKDACVIQTLEVVRSSTGHRYRLPFGADEYKRIGVSLPRAVAALLKTAINEKSISVINAVTSFKKKFKKKLNLSIIKPAILSTNMTLFS